jgi:hypothetical protein
LRSSLTRSVHRCLGLPIGRFLFGFHIVTSCTVGPPLSNHARPSLFVCFKNSHYVWFIEYCPQFCISSSFI